MLTELKDWVTQRGQEFLSFLSSFVSHAHRTVARTLWRVNRYFQNEKKKSL